MCRLYNCPAYRRYNSLKKSRLVNKFLQMYRLETTITLLPQIRKVEITLQFLKWNVNIERNGFDIYAYALTHYEQNASIRQPIKCLYVRHWTSMPTICIVNIENKPKKWQLNFMNEINFPIKKKNPHIRDANQHVSVALRQKNIYN